MDRLASEHRARVLPLLLALAATCLAGCEPSSTAPVSPSASRRHALTASEPSVERGGTIRVEFSQDIDAASLGRRSIRLFRGGRAVRFQAHAEGATLLVTPQATARARRRGTWRLLVEGAPSPRALRSVEGQPLARRHEWSLSLGRSDRLDLTPPRLIESVPSDGARDVPTGTPIELRFSEAVDRSVVRGQRSLRLLVNGETVATRQRLTEGRTVVQIRPVTPIPRGADVRVVAAGDVLDVAGNALEGDLQVGFATWDLQLHELTETFQTDEMRDVRATSCDWSGLRSPGYLVWATGRRVLGPLPTDPGVRSLGERSTIRFQVLLRADETETGATFASGLRLTFLERDVEAAILAATVDAGPSDLIRMGPSFEANRASAALLPVGGVGHDAPVDVVPDRDGFGQAEIPFELPLPLPAGEGVLLDVTLTLARGVHLLALPDPGRDALLDGGAGDRVRPLAQLLVTGGVPQARSLWYDSGAESPVWRRPTVAGALRPDGVEATVEFQVAPAGSDGHPDTDRASPWSADPASLPGVRFIRFRARFEGFPHDGRLPRIDRIVMPFETR